MRNFRRVCIMCLVLSGVAGCISPGDISALDLMDFGRPIKPTPRAQAYSHYLTSILLEQQGDFERALEELERIPGLDPNAITPTLRLIRAHLRQRDYDQALEMAEKAVSQAPERSNLWIVLGEIYHQMKRYDEATNAFTKAIELNPSNILGYGALVELQENTNDLISAIDIYHRLIELNPTSAGLHYQLGINLIRISDAENAKASLATALDLSPNLVRAHYFLGVLFLEAGDNETSAGHLRKYLAARPEDMEAQQMLAAILSRLGLYEDALRLSQEVLNNGEVQPQDYLAASYIALLAGEPELAEKLLPPEGAPVLSTLIKTIARQQGAQPWQATLEALDSVEGDINEEIEAYLGDLLYLFGRKQTGEALLSKLDEFENVRPESRVLVFLKARTLMSLDQSEEAVEVLNTLVTRHPDYEWAHYYLAVAHDELKHFEETESHLKWYLERHPDDPDVLNFLAYLYAENGVKLDEAEALLQKALAADPENPYYLDSLGWVYFKKGDGAKAVELIQRAIYGMDSDDAVLRDHLGDAYLLKGDVDRALAEWERAVRLDKELKGIQEKIDKHKKSGEVSALLQ